MTTRKTFVAIANAIRLSITDRAQREATAKALIPALKDSNPNFDRQRFLDACIGSEVTL